MKSANIAEHLCKMHGLFNLALSEGIVSTQSRTWNQST